LLWTVGEGGFQIAFLENWTRFPVKNYRISSLILIELTLRNIALGNCNFPWTRRPLWVFFPCMAQSEQKLVSPVSLAVDAVLVVAFFLFMYTVLAPHVPSRDHRMILLWGAVCSSCLTAVFWLALQMFRVTLRAQRRSGEGK
jgi:hypothetical protein